MDRKCFGYCFSFVLVSIWHSHWCFPSPAHFPAMPCATPQARVLWVTPYRWNIHFPLPSGKPEAHGEHKGQCSILHLKPTLAHSLPKALWHWWALLGISCLSGAALSKELPVIGPWGKGWDVLLPPQENGVEGSACCLPTAAYQKHCSNALPVPGLSGKRNHLLNTSARCWKMLLTRGGKVHHI